MDYTRDRGLVERTAPRVRHAAGPALLICTLLILGSTISGKQIAIGEEGKRPLLFLCNESLPPLNFTKDGKPSGVVVDLAHALAKRMRHPVEIRLMNWAEAQQLVLDGKADALLQINSNPDRLKLYDFSEPLLNSEFSIFTTGKHPGIESSYDLRGLKVGVERMGLPNLLLRQDPGIMVETTPDIVEGFRLLVAGDLDAVVADRRVGSYLLAENDIRGVRLAKSTISQSDSAIAVRKGNADLLEEINAALAEIRRDGTYDNILGSWQTEEVVFRTVEQLQHQNLMITAISLALLAALVSTVTLLIEIRRRKRTEATLRKSEERFRQAMDATSDGLWDWNAATDEVYFNPSYYRILGYEPGEFSATLQAWKDRVHPEDLERTVKVNMDCVEGRTESFTVEYRLRARTGEWRWILGRGKCISRDGQGRATRLTGTHMDITERKQAEEVLRLSEERFAKVFALNPSAICLTGFADSRIMDANPAFTGIFGYSREEFTGRTILELGLWPTLQDREAAITELQRSGFFRDRPQNMRTKSGEVRDFLSSAEAIMIGGEQMIVSTWLDITERKRAEDALRKREEEFRAVVENAPDVISLFERGLRRIYVNSYVRENTGMDTSFLIGKSLTEAGYPDSFTNPLNASLQKVFDTGREETVEVDYDAPKGHIWLQVRCAPLYGADGSIDRVVTIDRDITERKRMEKELRKSHEDLELRIQERTAELRVSNKALMDYATKLERLNQELEEFVFVASHDLQEPLRKIQTFGSIIVQKHKESLDEEAQAHVLRITGSAKRMSDSIHSLLHYSRITSEPCHCEPIDLGVVAREIARDLEFLIHQADGRVEISSLPTVEADAFQIRHLLQHLIENSIKYRKESECPVVKVHGEMSGDTCAIYVEDNGIGFDEEYLDTIFKPFQQLHGRGKFEGTGMGLALCRKIAERHDGSITARSTPGRGSKFIVRLPLAHRERG